MDPVEVVPQHDQSKWPAELTEGEVHGSVALVQDEDAPSSARPPRDSRPDHDSQQQLEEDTNEVNSHHAPATEVASTSHPQQPLGGGDNKLAEATKGQQQPGCRRLERVRHGVLLQENR
jgi:hypothetical protein